MQRAKETKLQISLAFELFVVDSVGRIDMAQAPVTSIG